MEHCSGTAAAFLRAIPDWLQLNFYYYYFKKKKVRKKYIIEASYCIKTTAAGCHKTDHFGKENLPAGNRCFSVV